VLNKYTIIGLVAGCIISGIGVVSFADSISTPIEKMEFNDIFQPGEKTTFPFSAPKDSKHYLTIEGDSFTVKVKSPDSDDTVNQNFKKQADISWISSEGENVIFIENMGKSELIVDGTIEKTRDPLFFTYHILVIIAGIVIIGFSAAFSAKKPRGF
jgi:hypothetical protein|tara:strand:+ start:4410 stop:4877 length:468 start_codon:yes stop_codon:yes gene_type:complete